MPSDTKPWPADSVERRSIDTLIPYARNARTHSDEQIAQVAASIKEWGWTMSVLVDEAGGLVAGHCRILAARKLGIAEVPVMVARGWSEAQKRAYVIADNKLAENAGWNLDTLGAEFAALSEAGFSLGLTGFSSLEIKTLTGHGFHADPDQAPPVPAVPVSMLGDVWVLGAHRLINGDCTVGGTVDRVLAGAKPHLMVTDPPYGVNYDPAWRGKAGIGNGGGAVGVVLNDDRADWRAAWALFPGDVAYVWHGGLHAGVVMESLHACRFVVRAQIIWVKSQLVISRSHYHGQHEPLLYAERDGAADDHWRYEAEHEDATYAVRGGQPATWFGGRRQSTVWNIEKPHKSETGHGTQKPVECMRRPMANNSKPGDGVYDPFMGSGTSLIAGEMLERRVFGCELSPGYVDVCVLRWQEFTGQVARLEASGRSFEAVAVDRLGRAAAEDAADGRVAEQRMAEVRADPSSLISGPELERRLAEIT